VFGANAVLPSVEEVNSIHRTNMKNKLAFSIALVVALTLSFLPIYMATSVALIPLALRSVAGVTVNAKNTTRNTLAFMWHYSLPHCI
jgi:hypothetical protein